MSTAENMLGEIAARIRSSHGVAAKGDIAAVASALGFTSNDPIAVGDDCAAIPDADGYTLFAIEGFMNEFVASDPWFAGWCGVMVNLSDIAAMGGRPTAVVNAVWSNGQAGAAAVLDGLKQASERFGVPIVGGHTNIRSLQSQFAVAILGRAKSLLTSFDAHVGDRLIAAIDLRGKYREPFSNWEAATDAPVHRLRGDLEVLPSIAETGLAKAAKDISQGGIIGTAAMLAECSGVGVSIDLAAIPKPQDIPLDRWLQTFPSYGYLISVPGRFANEVLAKFNNRGISAATIGDIISAPIVNVCLDDECETIWNFTQKPLIGCGPHLAKLPRICA